MTCSELLPWNWKVWGWILLVTLVFMAGSILQGMYQGTRPAALTGLDVVAAGVVFFVLTAMVWFHLNGPAWWE